MPSVYQVRLPLVIPRELLGAGAAVARAVRAVRAVVMRTGNIVNEWSVFEMKLDGSFCSPFVFQMRVLMARFRGLKSGLIKKKKVV
jgi:hypothetical protein